MSILSVLSGVELVIVFWHKCDFSIFEYGLVIFCFDFVGRKCNFLSFYVA